MDNKNGCGSIFLKSIVILVIMGGIYELFKFTLYNRALLITIIVVAILLISLLLIGYINNNKVTETISEIDAMDGIAFEKYTAKLLKNLGYYNVTVTQASNDYGVDVLAEKDGIKYAIQCKRYANKVNNSAVQEVVAGKIYYNCPKGMVITNNYFTENARELAAADGIILWDRNDLKRIISSFTTKKESKTNEKPVNISKYTGLSKMLVINGVEYDLEKPDDIYNIPYFETPFEFDGITYHIADYLKECAKRYEKSGLPDIANALFEKSNYMELLRNPSISQKKEIPNEYINGFIDANIKFDYIVAEFNGVSHHTNEQIQRYLKSKGLIISDGPNYKFSFYESTWDNCNHDIIHLLNYYGKTK